VARQTYEAWLPEEHDTNVMSAIRRTSVIEDLARNVPMNTDSKTFPRSEGMSVDVIPKGTAYGEDVSANDEVTIVAKKLGKAVRIAEEDIDDNVIDLIAQKKLDWGSAYAKYLDNASIGVNAPVGAGVPFPSIYWSVGQADAFTGYVANANRLGVTVPTYDDFSEVIGMAEESDWIDEASLLLIAHPSYKRALRGLKDSNGNPLWVQGLAGTPDTIFGYTVRWSFGAKVSAAATTTPAAQTGTSGAPAALGTAGNALLIACNRDALLLGRRSGPESVVIPGRDGVSSLTDETILKMRARRGFLPAFADAFVVMERRAVA
jgi:HK97 family phage major capsid protein